MKLVGCLLSLALVSATPVWAGEPEGFDPDQPFKQALSQRLLESLLDQALAALADHVEISGRLDSESAEADRKQTLRFKFYPEGKSKSDEHIAAEGWFSPSRDSRRQEFHFRFAMPKPPAEPPQYRLDNVL